MAESLSTYILHYRSSFLTTPAVSPAPTWHDLARVVARWVEVKERGGPQRDPSRWWAAAGNHKLPSGGTAQIRVYPSVDEVTSWAMRYEHPEKGNRFRHWRVDVALSRQSPHSDEWAVSATTSYSYSAGYVGRTQVPDPSCPRFVHDYLDSRLWTATVGPLRLGPGSVEIDTDSVGQFASMLEQDISTPVVLISNNDEGQYNLNPDALARDLAGVAVVCHTSSSAVAEGIASELDEPYRCTRGNVRVYYPPIQPDIDGDYQRHRFFPPSDFLWRSSEEIHQTLTYSLLRRSPYAVEGIIHDVAEVEHQVREAEIRARTDDAETSELLEYYAEEHRRADASATDYKSRLDDEIARADSLSDDLGRMSYRLREAESKAVEAAAAAAAVRERVSHLDARPSTVVDVLEFMAAVHGDALVVTDRARESAARAKINNQRKSIDNVWRCLYHVATTLHELYSDRLHPAVIRDHFQSRSGFELALTEGKMTRQSSTFMKLRELEHDGQVLDIQPHVKLGNGHDALRVHFAYHDGRIVVGHCGDHLDSYATQYL